MAFGNAQSLISLAIFVATYAGLALRNVKGADVPVWLVLLLGAAAMVISGSITVPEAYAAINLQVIVFLFSMFVLVTALDVSGALKAFSSRLLRRAATPARVLYLVFFGFALLSSMLMNDTIALMGTPIVITIARRIGMKVKPLLLALAFSITIGSVATPMGSPQNLLIAVASGMRDPVAGFAYYLLVPTLLNLAITAVILRVLFRRELSSARVQTGHPGPADQQAMEDGPLARRTVYVVLLTLAAIVLVGAGGALGTSVPFGISEVSLFGAALLLGISGKGREILASMDWGILVLFAALFVVMQAVSDNGIIVYLSSYLPAMNVGDPRGATLAIMTSSVVLSQLISNVPMVGLYLPLMKSLGFGPAASFAWTALAGGSTLAGNLTLMGAASNLIIVEQAERNGERLSFFEFLKTGALVAALNVAVLYAYLYLV